MRMTKIRRSRQNGFTLLEVVFAISIFFVGISGLMLLGAVSLARTNGQGNQATKTAEYAQDQMEQILSLTYTSTSVDSGLTDNSATCDFTAGPTSGCSVDYVTFTGTKQSSAVGAQYIRQVRVQDDGSGNFKTITVQVKALYGADYSRGAAFLAPMTTLSAQMTKN